MKVVLDVSGAFAAITGAPMSEQILNQLKNAEQVVAPDLYFPEVTNTAWKFHYIENAGIDISIEMAEIAIKLVDVFYSSELLWKDALELACKIQQPAYDCFYLTLAKKEKALLITTDRKLVSIAEKLKIETIYNQNENK